jgi:hypothetical protein
MECFTLNVESLMPMQKALHPGILHEAFSVVRRNLQKSPLFLMVFE